MTYNYNLVSAYKTERALEQHKDHYDAPYKSQPLAMFMDAVATELGDVKFHMENYSTAKVYRDGDIYDLGEIGYKDVRVRGSGSSMSQYYVRTGTIINTKYRDIIWQHNIESSKNLKSAVKLAKKHLVPLRPERNLELTAGVARNLIEKSVNIRHEVVRKHTRLLTGDSGWGQNYDTPFWEEVLRTEFIDPQVRADATTLRQAIADWREAESAKAEAYYVGLRDNFGQLVADTVQVTLDHTVRYEGMTTVDATMLPEWMQGRIAVLQLTPPAHYVDGVGVRLDDKVYYIVGEKG